MCKLVVHVLKTLAYTRTNQYQGLIFTFHEKCEGGFVNKNWCRTIPRKKLKPTEVDNSVPVDYKQSKLHQ